MDAIASPKFLDAIVNALHEGDIFDLRRKGPPPIIELPLSGSL